MNRIKPTTFGLAVVAVIGSGFANAQHSLRHSPNHYLLLNSERIASVKNAELVPGTPVEISGNPIMVEDKPWETSGSGLLPNVIFDPFEKFYKAWFCRDVATDGSSSGEPAVLYGTSHNGELWNKPLLDAHTLAGGSKTNILVRGTNGASVMRDTRDRKARYKLAYFAPAADGAATLEMKTRTSTNGIQWSAPADTGISTASTTQSNIHSFWAPPQREYVLTFPAVIGEKRVIARTSSKNYSKWSQPQAILEPATDSEQLLSMPVLELGGAFIGFPTVRNGVTGNVHSELAWSSDTKEWHRVKLGRPLVPAAKNDRWIGSAAAINDGIRLFYSEIDPESKKVSLNLARLGTDRLAGYQATAENEGVLHLNPLPWRGDKILVTADVGTESGYVLISAEDNDGNNVLKSTRLPSSGTDIELPASISDDAETLSLRIRFRDATVYSIRFR